MEFLNQIFQDFFLAKKLRPVLVAKLSSDDSLSYGSACLVGKDGRGQAIGGGGDMVDAGPCCAGTHTQAFIQCPDRGWIFLKKIRLQHTHAMAHKRTLLTSAFVDKGLFFLYLLAKSKNEFGVV